MNSEFSDKCRCATCGYVWIVGQDGRHSCATVLRGVLERIRNDPDLLKRPRAGGQDQYAGQPPIYRLLDQVLGTGSSLR